MSVGKQSKLNLDKKRRIVFVRDNQSCVAKGVFGFCGGDLTLQHRAGRGMGGSARMDGFENLVTMCQIHNELDTASADFHRLCVKLGWSMPRWVHEQNFADVIPVWYSGRGWFQLDSDGRVSMIPDTQAKHIMLSVYGPEFVTDPHAEV
jgi:hypothetical protein